MPSRLASAAPVSFDPKLIALQRLNYGRWCGLASACSLQVKNFILTLRGAFWRLLLGCRTHELRPSPPQLSHVSGSLYRWGSAQCQPKNRSPILRELHRLAKPFPIRFLTPLMQAA
jgi:hypothetical protein